MDPQEEEEILVVLVSPHKRFAGDMIHPVHISFSAQGPAPQGDRPEITLSVQRHATVEHEVVVHDAVQRTVG
jgi:hypothetical protein